MSYIFSHRILIWKRHFMQQIYQINLNHTPSNKIQNRCQKQMSKSESNQKISWACQMENAIKKKLFTFLIAIINIKANWMIRRTIKKSYYAMGRKFPKWRSDLHNRFFGPMTRIFFFKQDFTSFFYFLRWQF